MAAGYDGKPIGGYMGVYLSIVERYKANDPNVTKETFVQLCADLMDFREKHACDAFGQRSPIEGKNASLGFPNITASEAQALLTKIKTTILKD